MRTGNTLSKQWGGNISSAKWKTSLAPSDSTWYDYGYDMLGRLTESRYGCSAGSQSDYGRTYTYDLNGNPTGKETASYSEQWTCASGNAPATSVRTTASPFTILRQEGYTYDAVGNRSAVLDVLGDTLNVTAYNLLNLPEEYVTADGDTVKYVYSADGEKLFVKEIPSTGSSSGTEYAANYRIENGAITMIHTDAGYYTPVTPPSGVGNSSYTHFWHLKDHLGNNRVLADGDGNPIAVNDYDPFGEPISVAGFYSVYPFPPGAKESPYKYGDKEWNTTTSTYDFEARQFSPGFHRFTTMDPMCEDFYVLSPYSYCSNNPTNNRDPFGLYPKGVITYNRGYYSFTAPAAVLLSLVSGVEINQIISSHIHKTGGLRQFPLYEKAGAMTVGNMFSRPSITLTKFSFDDVSGCGQNTDAWLAILSHEVRHIPHTRYFLSTRDYLLAFAISYALALGHDNALLEKDADIGMTVYISFRDYVNSVLGKDALSKTFEGSQTDQTKIRQIMELWAGYQSSLGVMYDNTSVTEFVNRFNELEEGVYQYDGKEWVRQ